MGVFSSAVFAGPAKVALVVFSIGGLTAGAYFAYQTTQSDADTVSGQTEPTVTASPTAPLATLTPTAEPATPQPTPTATALPPTQPPPTPTQPPAPTADTRVPIRDLPTADQIQLGKDGKYFIADRGDGCTWVERVRETDPELGVTIILHTDCPAFFAYAFRLTSGEVFILVS